MSQRALVPHCRLSRVGDNAAEHFALFSHRQQKHQLQQEACKQRAKRPPSCRSAERLYCSNRSPVIVVVANQEGAPLQMARRKG